MRPDAGTTQLPKFVPRPKGQSEDLSRHTVLNWINVIHHLGRTILAASPETSELDEIREERSGYTPHDMTYLKLQMVGSYAREFLTRASRYTDHLFYLDVLSASGLSYARGRVKDPIPGSCFIAPLALQDFESPSVKPDAGFGKVWAFERDENALGMLRRRKEALVRRTDLHLPEFEYVGGDVNSTLAGPLSEIERFRERRPLTLAFVDNQGLDVTMATVALLQRSIRADLIVHIPTSGIWRTIQAARATGVGREKLTSFFGSESWADLKSADAIPGLYHETVRRVTGATFQEFPPVQIRGSNHTFHLGFYVRDTGGTKGKPGWMGKLLKRAEACGSIDTKAIREVLDIGTGRQRTLDQPA